MSVGPALAGRASFRTKDILRMYLFAKWQHYICIVHHAALPDESGPNESALPLGWRVSVIGWTRPSREGVIPDEDILRMYLFAKRPGQHCICIISHAAFPDESGPTGSE
jgi:hypothetical protein